MRLFQMLLAAGFLAAGNPVARAEVLIVADEFPAMEVLAGHLKTMAGRESRIVAQNALPERLDAFETVIVYIHGKLELTAENALIDYTRRGGRLLALHHSISSGKRRNPRWFSFLGVELSEAAVEQGGYKWIEGIDSHWVNLEPNDWVMRHEVTYPKAVAYQPSGQERAVELPAFELKETEVYLNHKLVGKRRVVMGLKYRDADGKTWMQSTAGWCRSSGQGWIFYFMPGHSVSDFENPQFARVLVNAVSVKTAQLQTPAQEAVDNEAR